MDEATLVVPKTSPTTTSRVCPDCGAVNEVEFLGKNRYRCKQCGETIAHLDITDNGTVQGIYGWLRSAGDIIDGRYLVKSILGRGGFGVTYLVEDLRLGGKHRAVKVIPEARYDEYETSLLTRLTHPAIPDIIDRGTVDGMVYLVLEFGGNRTLSSERKNHQGRIPLKLLMPWMQQVCEVLIYLHSQKPPIIHRDLKPGNILLDENNRIMLIDFGISKESQPSTETRATALAASPGFSSPEQEMNTGTDERSDIYSLTATFYALLTGVTPPTAGERFSGKDIKPPSELVAELPAQMDEFILKGLSFNLNQRYQTMLEFSEALSAMAAQTPTTVSTAKTQQDEGERTVVLSKTRGTGTLSTHSTSIKLPDGSHTTAAPVMPSESGGQSNKTVWLVSGVVLAVILIALSAYFILQKSEETPEANSLPQATVAPNNAPSPEFPPGTVIPPAAVTTPVAPAQMTPPATPAQATTPPQTVTTAPSAPVTATAPVVQPAAVPAPVPTPVIPTAPYVPPVTTSAPSSGSPPSSAKNFEEELRRHMASSPESMPSSSQQPSIAPSSFESRPKSKPRVKTRPRPEPDRYSSPPPPPKNTGSGDWRNDMTVIQTK